MADTRHPSLKSERAVFSCTRCEIKHAPCLAIVSSFFEKENSLSLLFAKVIIEHEK